MILHISHIIRIITLVGAMGIRLTTLAQSNMQLPPELARMLPPGITFVPDETPMNFDYYKKIDDSKKEFLYYYVSEDPKSELINDIEMMLQVGDKVSKFLSYGGYRSDSIGYVHKSNNIPITRDEWQIKLYGSTDTMEEIFRWHEDDDSLTFLGHVGTALYYEEPSPEFNWVLCEDTKQIGPYLCRKATTSIYGRDWVAWYSDEIPIAEGPWKLSGLPGLIVMANDSKSEHVFKLTSIRDASVPIIKAIEVEPSKTDRVKFNKMRRNRRINTLRSYEGTEYMPTDLNGNPLETPKNVKRFDNDIEID